MEDVTTHPYSFERPIFVHRECLPMHIRFLGAGRPYFSIYTNLEMAVPSIAFLAIIFVFMISLMPTTELTIGLSLVFLCLLAFRINFMRYYVGAVKSFQK